MMCFTDSHLLQWVENSKESWPKEPGFDSPFEEAY